MKEVRVKGWVRVRIKVGVRVFESTSPSGLGPGIALGYV